MPTIILSYVLFLLVAAYFYYMDIRHRINRRTARKDLAEAAKELGLRSKKSGDLGIYEGRLEGYFVRITPEDYIKFTIMLKSPVAVWILRTSRLEKLINRNFMSGPFPESAEFFFRNNDINRFFHYRYAPKDQVAALGHADMSVAHLAALAVKWRWTMGQMSITGGSITASPLRGTMNKCHSITGRQLKDFLPDLVALAKMWDALPELNRTHTRRNG